MYANAIHVLHVGVEWVRLALESIGALVVLAGAVRGVAALLAARAEPPERRFVPVRLTLARYLSLALEFQLAADILSTAISPSWNEIGKLGAIAVIRTGLNYFLGREVAEETRQAAALAAQGPAREQANHGGAA